MSLQLRSTSAQETQQIGELIGNSLTAGDLILLHGNLGAGKTTFVQGLGRGLGVEGRIISPTFIIARVHESLDGGPDLIHVDAYRIEDDLDLETLDLDASLADSVTVVEWGAGKAEVLSDSRLEIFLEDAQEYTDWLIVGNESRNIRVVAVGPRWQERLEQTLSTVLHDFKMNEV